MIITKEFISDLKKASAVVVRFNGKYSSIDVFKYSGKLEVNTTYQYQDLSAYTGNWHFNVYAGQSMPLTTFIKSLRAGDLLDLYIENHETDNLKALNILNVQLIARIRRHRKNSDILSSTKDYFIDSLTTVKTEYTPIQLINK